MPSSALRTSKCNKDDITTGPDGASTPNRAVETRPQGSLPMACDNNSLVLEDMQLNTGEEEGSKAKSDPKESDNKAGSRDREKDEDSIGRAVADTRKNLFQTDGTSTPGV
jgi:hypothetical protein